MKLIRFGNQGSEKPGILLDDVRMDCSEHFTDWNRAFFENNGLEELEALIANKKTALPQVSKNVRWAPCVSRPNMILCIGLNYSDHAAEAGMEVPKEPILFMKATNTIAGPYDDVIIPKNSKKTDWEVELAIVLKRDVLYLKDEKEAENAIAGYCIMNDISEREFQLERAGQWVKGKSCPGFSPLGPFLLTQDKMKDLQNLKMQLSVNNEMMQQGNTSTMVFKPAFLVHYISQFMRLEAGDVITTGTPPGVGMGITPAKFLRDGDLVNLSIEHLGTQQQRFVDYHY